MKKTRIMTMIGTNVIGLMWGVVFSLKMIFNWIVITQLCDVNGALAQFVVVMTSFYCLILLGQTIWVGVIVLFINIACILQKT